MIFWASCVLGPAAGPKGVSIFSPKMGKVRSPERTGMLRTPKMLPSCAYSSRIQFIRCPNDTGLMISPKMLSSSPDAPVRYDQ